MAGHAAVLADHKEEAEMSDHPELLTLSEVSKRTKISMPTLQRYKKQYQRRIPSVGKGRKQRYPVEALEVFQTLKTQEPRQAGASPERAGSGAGKPQGHRHRQAGG